MRKSAFPDVKIFILILVPVLLLSAIPFFVGPGLTTPEPIGRYLNGALPSTISKGEYYVPVFTNITFDSPLSFNEVSGNKIVVGQRDGKIYWFDKSETVTLKNLTLDLSDRVGLVWDGGMMSTLFHPNFGTSGNNYMYTFYATKDSNGNDFPDEYFGADCNNTDNWGNYLVLARYTVNPNTLVGDKNSEQILFKIRMYSSAHRGGAMLFGDDDFLYITIGDQGAAWKSQDIANNIDGSVLRIDVNKDATKSHSPIKNMPDDYGFSDEITGNGYWIPNDNPFLSSNGSNFEEYYALGLRSPHRMTKDRNTGEIYIGEVGANRHDEINVLEKGKNYGWPLYEGLYSSTSCVSNLYNNMAHEEPLSVFPRANVNSLSGGYVYRGTKIAELQGKYICADYGIGEEIWSININNGSYEQLGNFSSTDIISFGEDSEGELYILKYGVSTLYKIVSPNAVINNSPTLLSETNAFSDLETLTPADGVIPYDLVESFWSDGAEKKRWMVIPNDGTHNTAEEKIDFSENGDWQFPVGTVLIKHFELPIDKNDPSVTKRLETRFSVKSENGEFYFITYKWNDEQTDAILLDSDLDESIEISQTDGNTVTQVWHYPNQGECITCHKTISGGTLGPRTRYLNRNITYPKTGISANQLVTLSHLGILDETITDTDTGNYLSHKALDDATASLDEKARSYLDLNCAYCHRADTGNRANFDLSLSKTLAETGLFTANANEPLGIPDEEIIVAGNASKSIIYNRINSTIDGIAMPPLAKNIIDENGAKLIKDWINQLEAPSEGGTLPNGLSDLAEGVFYIESKNSGKIIDVAGASYDDGANIQQNTNSNQDFQKIRLTKQGNGYYTLTLEHSSKAIEVFQNESNDGTNVQQATITQEDKQLWGFKSKGDGYYQIVAKSSGFNLDVFGASLEDGANVIIWTPNDDINQLWKLIEVNDSTLSNGYFTNNNIELVLDSNPVSDFVTVKIINFTENVNQIKYSIFSITGEMVLKKTGSKTETFDISRLSRGLYIFKAEIEGKFFTNKIVIE